MAISGSLNFLTASEVGSWVAANNVRLNVRSITGSANAGFIFNDFVGLNTNVYEPISGTAGTTDAGYPGLKAQGQELGTTFLDAVNTLGFPSQVVVNNVKFNYRGGLTEELLTTDPVGAASLLNTLLHHRNGPYQHPSWKQIRGGDHPVARKLRLNNTMSIDAGRPKKTVNHYDHDKYYPQPHPDLRHRLIKSTSFGDIAGKPDLRHYYEPSVVSHYKPFMYEVGSVTAKQSLFNQLTYFSNDELNERLGLSDGDIMSTGSTQDKEEQYQAIFAARNIGAQNFRYAQTIFPRAFNTYRNFTVEKPRYEQNNFKGAGGSRHPEKFGLMSYNVQQYRTFWKNSQPPAAISASVPGGFNAGDEAMGTTLSSRLRDPEVAVNSQLVTQSFSVPGLYVGISPADSNAAKRMSVTGTIVNLPYMDNHIDIGADDHVIRYIRNGIVTNQINCLSGGLDQFRNASTGSGMVQLDAFQPYPITLLSTWPLDVRDDIYSKPNYLTSSRGGQGLMIGLTPHSATSSAASQGFAGSQHLYHLSQSFASAITGTMSLITRSAGELVYSTKPTVFFRRHQASGISTNVNPTFAAGAGDGRGTAETTSSFNIHGYSAPTASLQFLRHVYPYNSPFWVTHKVAGRNPMYDSYEAFIGDELRYIAKDYSIVSEFRISDSDHFLYYADLINNFEDSSDLVYYKKQDVETGKYKILRAIEADVSDYLTNNETYRYHKLDFLKLEGSTGVTGSGPRRGAESIRELDKATTEYDWTPEAEMSPGSSYQLATGLSKAANRFKLEIKRENQKHTYKRDAQAVEFFKRYAHADDLTDFSKLLNSRILGDSDLVPSKINFKCRGIKKLLPYNGFYPVTRTVQIGAYFKNAFGSDQLLQSDLDIDLNSKLQTLLEPTMAPGVLYNSIKSGIAVDYHINKTDGTMSHQSFTPAGFYAPVNNPTSSGMNASDLEIHVTGAIPYGAFQAQGARLVLPGVVKSFERSYGGGLTTRFSFDLLRNTSHLKKFFSRGKKEHSVRTYLTPDYFDLNRHFYASNPDSNVIPSGSHLINNVHFYMGAKSITSITNGGLENLYQDSVQNFLAETMDFFLKDQMPGVKMPILFSNPIDSELAADMDSTYYAAVSLEMGKDQVLCEGPRDSGLHIPSSTSTTHNVTSSLRGYLYGPPIEIVDHATATDATNARITTLKNDNTVGDLSMHYLDSESYYMYNLQDPAYQTYTPPYFYGKSSMVFSFTPETNTNDLLSIFSRCLQQSGSFYKEEYDLDNRLAITVPTSGSAQKISTGRMKIDASVDIFNNPVQIRTLGSNDSAKNVWYINPKWVCPVLDFSSSYAAYEETTSTSLSAIIPSARKFKLIGNAYHSASTGKSIWGGYGTDPYDAAAMRTIYKKLNLDPSTMEKGITLKLEESFLESRRITSENNNIDGRLSGGREFFTERNAHRAESHKTGSLITDVKLFEEQSVNIGQIANHKDISEAVVVIPYFEQPIDFRPIESKNRAEIYSTRHVIPGKHFLPINKQVFENVLSILLSRRLYDPSEAQFGALYGSSNQSYKNAGETDCGEMIKQLLGIDQTHTGYQIPPEFDFIHNAAVDPFQMIVIPFSHRLRKQDLINIYQGVMPDISMYMEKQLSQAATHPKSNTPIDPTIYSQQEFKSFSGAKIKTNLGALNLANFLSPQVFTEGWVNTISHSIANGRVPNWTVKDFYKNIKFMVFKVKQKAAKNYDVYKKRQIATAIKEKFIDTDSNRAILEMPDEFQNVIKNVKSREVYGTNWPYDYFSLIEAIKLDIEVTM